MIFDDLELESACLKDPCPDKTEKTGSGEPAFEIKIKYESNQLTESGV